MSVTIAVDFNRTYAYAANPENLPAWAPGFVSSIEQLGGRWVAMTTLVEATFLFASPNPFGVVDHDVEVAGERFHNPMRVIPNGAGPEVLFTLLQLPGVDDERFAQDIGTVTADLHQFKNVLELRYASAACRGVAGR